MFNVTLCLSMGSLSLLAWLLTACRMSTVCGQLTCARPERLRVTVRTEPEARALGRSLRPLTGLSERKETTVRLTGGIDLSSIVSMGREHARGDIKV